jgi:hypothetical protein
MCHMLVHILRPNPFMCEREKLEKWKQNKFDQRWAGHPDFIEGLKPISIMSHLASWLELTEYNIWQSPRFDKSYIPTQRNDVVDHCIQKIAYNCEEDVEEHLELQSEYEIGLAFEGWVKDLWLIIVVLQLFRPTWRSRPLSCQKYLSLQLRYPITSRLEQSTCKGPTFILNCVENRSRTNKKGLSHLLNGVGRPPYNSV